MFMGHKRLKTTGIDSLEINLTARTHVKTLINETNKFEILLFD